MTKAEQQKQWDVRVSEFKASGQSQAAWCKAQNINLRTFNYWFVKSKKTVSPSRKPSNWISLKAREREENPRDSVFKVKIGQAAIEVKPNFDSVLLLNIVKVLSTLC